MKTTFTKVATGWRWEIDDDDATFSGVRPTKVEAHAEALACWSGVLYAEVNRDSPAPEPQPDWRARAEAADHDRDDMERERDAARACAADLADLRDAATARAEAAEQRAEALAAEVARLRADRAVATTLAIMAMGLDAHEVLPHDPVPLLKVLRAECLAVLPPGAQSDEVAAYVRAMCGRIEDEAQPAEVADG